MNWLLAFPGRQTHDILEPPRSRRNLTGVDFSGSASETNPGLGVIPVRQAVKPYFLEKLISPYHKPAEVTPYPRGSFAEKFNFPAEFGSKDLEKYTTKADQAAELARQIHVGPLPNTLAMPKPKRNVNAVYEETLTPPDSLTTDQRVARVKQAAGNNLYYLELPGGEQSLAELEAKFRSTIWIKRGSYVIVDSAAIAERNNKIDGLITNIVRDEKAWRKMPYWPAEFIKRTGYGVDSDDDGPKMPTSDSEDE